MEGLLLLDFWGFECGVGGDFGVVLIFYLYIFVFVWVFIFFGVLGVGVFVLVGVVGFGGWGGGGGFCWLCRVICFCSCSIFCWDLCSSWLKFCMWSYWGFFWGEWIGRGVRFNFCMFYVIFSGVCFLFCWRGFDVWECVYFFMYICLVIGVCVYCCMFSLVCV